MRMQLWWLPLAAAWACTAGKPEPSDPTGSTDGEAGTTEDTDEPPDTTSEPPDSGDTGGPPPGDPVAAALGGCTARIERTIDGQPSGTADVVYDENGDRVDEHWVGTDWETRATTEYGAPHQESRFLHDDLVDDQYDYEVRYVWEDGRRIEETTDLGADGVDDEIMYRGYDNLGLWRFTHWDVDADGVVDDFNDWTWTPDGADWYGIGTGIDPLGVYTTEGWADPDGWMYRYTYDDDRGVHYEWNVSRPNELGTAERYVQRQTVAGEYAWESDLQRTFDAAGRVATETYDQTLTFEGQAPDVTILVQSYTYDCP